MRALGADCLDPFDLDANPEHDILNEAQHRLLLRVASSGMGSGWSAPPRKEFSRLKLKQPGPKALRTPDFKDGVPGLSKDERHRVDASTEIHARSRLVSMVHQGIGGADLTGAAPLVNGMASARQRHSTPRARDALRKYSSMPARHGRV